ncbi:MAG TPA: MnmC family methyltransferase [Spirochaetota bacterium]|nr:MnmC family methyltransferase [Spirochaetota bacterium]HPJ33279.1 MnmC family methyltransferase [Spirochaetota bacterium]
MNDKKNYLIQTADGTSTLFLEEYDQTMHSDSGAYEESLLKHVYPSGVLKLHQKNINVLDIGFGLGYNVLALIYEFQKTNKNSTLNIVSLEKDKTLHPFIKKIKFNDDRDIIYSFIRDVYLEGKGSMGNINLEILFGDGREFLKEMSGIKFDAVFQDPFSPSKNPEMWSVEYFSCINKLMSESAILTTYSSADHIRMAMIEAGLKTGIGPSVGRKREGTLASKSELPELLPEERIRQITGNIKSEPYRDFRLSMEREEILSERLERIRARKLK